MNNRKRKLRYIRYKNIMKQNGYHLPKWELTTKAIPFIWVNHKAELFEESWLIDWKGMAKIQPKTESNLVKK